jgi:hypothetical protein
LSVVGLLAAGATVGRCATAATKPSGRCFGRHRGRRLAEITGSPLLARVNEAEERLYDSRDYHLRILMMIKDLFEMIKDLFEMI